MQQNSTCDFSVRVKVKKKDGLRYENRAPGYSVQKTESVRAVFGPNEREKVKERKEFLDLSIILFNLQVIFEKSKGVTVENWIPDFSHFHRYDSMILILEFTFLIHQSKIKKSKKGFVFYSNKNVSF